MAQRYRVTVESDCERTHRETYVVRASSIAAAWDRALEDDDNVASGWIPVDVVAID